MFINPVLPNKVQTKNIFWSVTESDSEISVITWYRFLAIDLFLSIPEDHHPPSCSCWPYISSLTLIYLFTRTITFSVIYVISIVSTSSAQKCRTHASTMSRLRRNETQVLYMYWLTIISLILPSCNSKTQLTSSLGKNLCNVCCLVLCLAGLLNNLLCCTCLQSNNAYVSVCALKVRLKMAQKNMLTQIIWQ